MRIFLIGFMGCGKSFWSKRWAPQMGLRSVDLDELIEKEEGMPAIDIFDRKGEEYFREVETRQLRALSTMDDIIVSCGGGTPCFHDNLSWMQSNGLTVYINASPQFLLEKLSHDAEKRPLIRNINEAELLFFIEGKLKERKPFYDQAALTLSATELNDLSWKAFT